jgi:hypothetical protein
MYIIWGTESNLKVNIHFNILKQLFNILYSIMSAKMFIQLCLQKCSPNEQAYSIRVSLKPWQLRIEHKQPIHQ